MDSLRWVLAGIGVVIVAGVYVFGRLSTRERKPDLVGFASAPTKGGSYNTPTNQTKVRKEPEISITDTTQVADQNNFSQSSPQGKEIESDEVTNIPSTEHASFLKETLEFEMQNESSAEQSEEENINTQANEEPSISPAEHASFLKETLAFEVEEETFAQLEDAVESVLGPDIEDEIIDVQIPEDLPELQENEELVIGNEIESEAGSLKKEQEKEEVEEKELEHKEPAQQELALDIEPLVLVLSVMASNDGMLSGEDIKQVLDDEKLEFGDMDVFNFYIEDKKHPIFSAASIIEPGVFNLETIDEYETPGLILFSQLPGSIPGAEAFDILLNKSRKIAEKLGGQVCDDKRNKLTEQATTHYRDKIVSFEHDVMLARKKLQQ